MLVGTGAEEIKIAAILVGARRHQARDVHLAQAFRHLREFAGAQAFGDFFEQLVDARYADGGKHRFDVGFGMRNKRHMYS